MELAHSLVLEKFNVYLEENSSFWTRPKRCFENVMSSWCSFHYSLRVTEMLETVQGVVNLELNLFSTEKNWPLLQGKTCVFYLAYPILALSYALCGFPLTC